MFEVVSGLKHEDCTEFEGWLVSRGEDAHAVILSEYEKMRAAGLTRDTSCYIYEDAYETHVVLCEEAAVYFLFFRNITDNKIVSLGCSAVEHGKNNAVELSYHRACAFMGRALRNPYRVIMG